MLPTSNINAPNWDDWVNAADGSRILDSHQANFQAYTVTYKIGKQRIAGRWVYNRFDCEAAAVKIAAKRAERAARQAAAQSVS